MSVVALAIPDFGQTVLNLYLIFYRFYYQNSGWVIGFF